MVQENIARWLIIRGICQDKLDSLIKFGLLLVIIMLNIDPFIFLSYASVTAPGLSGACWRVCSDNGPEKSGWTPGDCTFGLLNMYLLPLLNEGVVLGDPFQGQLVHQVDLIRVLWQDFGLVSFPHKGFFLKWSLPSNVEVWTSAYNQIEISPWVMEFLQIPHKSKVWELSFRHKNEGRDQSRCCTGSLSTTFRCFLMKVSTVRGKVAE